MLLDYARAESDGRQRDGGRQSMVGNAHRHAEARPHIGEGAQVRLLDGCRIGGGAFQQGYMRVLLAVAGRKGLVYLVFAGDSRGDDDRLALSCDVFYQGDVCNLETCDLVSGHVVLRKVIDGRFIEGGREQDDACVLRCLLEGGQPLPGGVRRAVEVVQVGSVPERTLLDAEPRLVAVDGDGIRRVGLYFDGVGAGLRGCVQGLHGGLEAPAVVCGQFRDDERTCRVAIVDCKLSE